MTDIVKQAAATARAAMESLSHATQELSDALAGFSTANKTEQEKRGELDEYILVFTASYQFKLSDKRDSQGELKPYATNDKLRDNELRVALSDDPEYAALHDDHERAGEASRTARLALDIATNEFRMQGASVRLQTAILNAIAGTEE